MKHRKKIANRDWQIKQNKWWSFVITFVFIIEFALVMFYYKQYINIEPTSRLIAKSAAFCISTTLIFVFVLAQKPL